MINLISKSNGYPLVDHLKGTAEKCVQLCNRQNDNKDLTSLLYLCGLMHDLGKATDKFQNHLKNGAIIDYDHSYLSALIVSNFIKLHGFNSLKDPKKLLIKAILFHHPITKDNSFDFSDISTEQKEFIKTVIETFNNSEYSFGNELSFNDISEDDFSNLPSEYVDNYLTDDEQFDKTFMFIFSILRFSDIWDSDSNDKKNIDIDNFTKIANFSKIKLEKPEEYTDRFYVQQEVSEKLLAHKISCFKSETGFGKTMVGLSYLLKDNRKGFWICPRLSITEGIYKSICDELDRLGLSKLITVGLMITGEFKKCNRDESVLNSYKNGLAMPDITVINIDSFLRPMFKTDSNIRNLSLVDCNCIFDEFHECFTKEPLMAIYLSLLKCRKHYCNNTHTLLLSATPNKFLYENFIDDANSYIYHKCDFISAKKLRIHYCTEIPNKDFSGTNTLIYVNSVKTCQSIYKLGHCDNIIHAKYTPLDREIKNAMVYNTHGKKAIGTFYCWVSTCVISTGVDVSFNNMVLVYVTPDGMLQVLGRCDRWVKFNGICDIYICLPPEYKKSEMSVIQSSYSSELMYKFADFLKANISEGEHTLGELYDLCDEFNKLYHDDYKSLFKKFKNESFSNLGKIKYSYSHKSNDDTKKIISKNASIRSVNSDKIYLFVPDSDMKEPMQVEFNSDYKDIKSCYCKLEERLIDNIENTKSLIKEGDNYKKYFKNERSMKCCFNDKDYRVFDKLKNMSRDYDTPFLSTNVFGYSSELGLYEKDKSID